ncbi:hypothetical protein KC326_g103 [Hortaea werneckii]|nr:hypothetical protein KC326_g103 [Hortaea werneckii]
MSRECGLLRLGRAIATAFLGVQSGKLSYVGVEEMTSTDFAHVLSRYGQFPQYASGGRGSLISNHVMPLELYGREEMVQPMFFLFKIIDPEGTHLKYMAFMLRAHGLTSAKGSYGRGYCHPQQPAESRSEGGTAESLPMHSVAHAFRPLYAFGMPSLLYEAITRRAVGSSEPGTSKS